MISLVTKSALFRILEAVIVTVIWGVILVVMELIALDRAQPVIDNAAKPFESKIDPTIPGDAAAHKLASGSPTAGLHHSKPKAASPQLSHKTQ